MAYRRRFSHHHDTTDAVAYSISRCGHPVPLPPSIYAPRAYLRGSPTPITTTNAATNSAPTVVVQPNPLVTSRSSLPSARRQASQSVWAPGRRQFNVAEWAQKHRPRISTSSTNAAAPSGTSNATASHQNTSTRYGSNVDIMYSRGTGQTSEQLRSLTKSKRLASPRSLTVVRFLSRYLLRIPELLQEESFVSAM